MALQKHKGKLTYTETPMIRHGTFYVTDAADKEIADLQAEVDELAKLLTEGCNGFGSVLIQTSDMKAVNDWRKRVKEYLLITKHRSK